MFSSKNITSLSLSLLLALTLASCGTDSNKTANNGGGGKPNSLEQSAKSKIDSTKMVESNLDSISQGNQAKTHPAQKSQGVESNPHSSTSGNQAKNDSTKGVESTNSTIAKPDPSKTGKLVIYTSYEEKLIAKYLAAFKRHYPNIKVSLARDSSGIISAKFGAEGANVRADILYGVNGTNFLRYANSFVPFAYDTTNIAKVFYDQKSPVPNKPRWIGLSGSINAMSFNTKEAAKLGIEPPTSYANLLDPKYKGNIIMPNPNSSGTGYSIVSSLVTLMGYDKAFSYMKKLNDNIKLYTHSGTQPTKMAATGEAALGLGMAFISQELAKKGAPLKTIFPKEGVSYILEVMAIVKKPNISPLAVAFVTWALSHEAMELYAEDRGLVTNSTISKKAGYPDNLVKKIINFDILKESREKPEILARWKKEFDK